MGKRLDNFDKETGALESNGAKLAINKEKLRGIVEFLDAAIEKDGVLSSENFDEVRTMLVRDFGLSGKDLNFFPGALANINSRAELEEILTRLR